MPIINGLSNISHPCQILADIMAYNEKRGAIKNKKFVWLGDLNNVLYSWIEASVIFNFSLSICCPKLIKISKELKAKIKTYHNNVKIFYDTKMACRDSDCIITDTWFSMGKKPTKKLLKAFKPYQVNEAIMSMAKKNAVFMHCLPATRGNEVTEDVIDNLDYSLVWSEAENRLHVQKAILEWCLKKI